MDKYLLEILKEINTIIIPGLGALTITDASSGEIMFMTYLKHDDGQLAKHIAEKEGMDETEAKNLIAKYVREITTKLDQGESYDMFQFGSFYKNDDGDVDFKGWNKSQKEEPKAEEKKEKEKEKPVAEKKSTAKKTVAKKKATEKKSTPKKETTNKTAPVEKKEESKEVKPIEKEKPVSEEKPKKELNIEEKEELAKNQEKLEVLRKSKTESEPRKKRGAGFYILVVLVAIIGIGSIYVAFDYENVKQHIPFLADASPEVVDESDPLEEMKEIIGGESDELETEEETEIAEDEAVMENEPEEEIVEEEVVEEEVEKVVEEEISSPPPPSGSGNYHIIAGAFSSEDNANRLAAKFREQGYDVTVGVVNGLNMVSIGSYASSAEAQQALPEMQASASSAWIYNGSL